jgi:hypothetical protein
MHLEVRRKVPTASVIFLTVRVVRRQLAELVVRHDQVETGSREDPLDGADRGIGRLAGLDARNRDARQPGA